MPTLQEVLAGIRTGGALSAPQAPSRQIPGPAPLQPTAPTRSTAPAPLQPTGISTIGVSAPQPRQLPGPAPLQPTGGGISAPTPQPRQPTQAPVQQTAPQQGKLQGLLAGIRAQAPAGVPDQPAEPLNIGDIIRRLMGLQPRQYANLLPSDRARLASAFSQLGVPPEDAFFSIERQFPQGADPSRLSFGAGF